MPITLFTLRPIKSGHICGDFWPTVGNALGCKLSSVFWLWLELYIIALQVVSLPYFDWADLDTLESQQEYLKAKLNMTMTPETSKINNLPGIAAIPVSELKGEIKADIKKEEPNMDIKPPA